MCSSYFTWYLSSDSREIINTIYLTINGTALVTHPGGGLPAIHAPMIVQSFNVSPIIPLSRGPGMLEKDPKSVKIIAGKSSKHLISTLKIKDKSI